MKKTRAFFLSTRNTVLTTWKNVFHLCNHNFFIKRIKSRVGVSKIHNKIEALIMEWSENICHVSVCYSIITMIHFLILGHWFPDVMLTLCSTLYLYSGVLLPSWVSPFTKKVSFVTEKYEVHLMYIWVIFKSVQMNTPHVTALKVRPLGSIRFSPANVLLGQCPATASLSTTLQYSTHLGFAHKLTAGTELGMTEAGVTT